MRSLSPGSNAPSDRRRHRRFLTTDNVAAAALIVLLLLAVLNVYSEVRDSTGGKFGRLYGREMAKGTETTPTVVEAPPVVVPIEEAASADPFSLDSAAREQYLGSPTLTPPPAAENETYDGSTYSENPTVLEQAETAPAAKPWVESSTHGVVKIVGGPEGVMIDREESRPAPVLGGGFGRP